MAGGSDPFQSFFEKVDGGLLRCIFCEKTLAGSTSTTRMKYHLARVGGGGVKICEKVTPDVQRAAFDKLPDRMRGSMQSSSNNIIVTADSDPAQDLEMQQQGHPLLDEFPSMDSLTGEEIWLAEETMVPSMLMPDAPETGLGIEPADQPFEKDMNNIPYSLMRNVELSSGTENMTWELRQAVTERGSCSKMPVDKSVPSSSNNIIVTADSDPAQDLEMQQQGQPLLDDFSWMDSLTWEEIVLPEETMVPSMHMPDAPATGLGIEPADQPFEMYMNNITSSLTRDVELSSGIESRELMQAVTERGSCSKMPVDKCVPSSSNNERINAASTALRGLEMEQEQQPLSDERGWKGFPIGGETEHVEEPRAPVFLISDEPDTRQRTESFVVRGSSSKRPVHKRPRTTRYDLRTKIAGQAFKRNKEDVCSWLLNDEVSCIGIYGMGGVGKTTLATHILDNLQEKPDIFPCVYWITDSREFSVHALQDLIANAFGLCLQNGKDVMIRARELWTALSVIKGVLILDNLWGHFLADEVGIPLRTDGLKLLLTTRSSEICRKMDCQRIIKVESLSEGEAWDLFKYRLGRGGTLYPEIAQSIVKECAGLPLGIVTMARSMKGVDGEYRWRDALLKLRRLEVGPGEMEANVFRVLKFSYAQLNDSALQECFLHITLFPKGKIIWREDLIEYLIDEGIVKEMGSRYAQFDRGHTMLDQLEDASLLEGSRDDEDYRYVKMHDLIWDMAWKILNERGGGLWFKQVHN